MISKNSKSYRHREARRTRAQHENPYTLKRCSLGPKRLGMPRSPSFTWLHHLRTRSSVALVPWCLALILVAINPPLPLDMKPMNRDSGACQRLYSALENSNFGGSHLKRLKSLPPPRFAAVGWIETERLNVEPSRPHVCAVIIGRSRGGMVLHPQKNRITN